MTPERHHHVTSRCIATSDTAHVDASSGQQGSDETAGLDIAGLDSQDGAVFGQRINS